MSSDSVDVKILTLNCWGLGLGISKNRSERMEDIGMFIASKDYDIVLLQEVWKRENYLTIKGLVSPVLPNGHYFDNGIIGTGTCVFTKPRINDCTFHEFGLNGYPHKLTHGDWFGGKGLGVCQVEFNGFIIHIFTSHYHATYDYNPLKDVYVGHRVVHGVESAQWIKLASSCADLTIYGGDFNTEPKDVPYRIVRHVTPLNDAWEEANGPEGGETSETPNNKYTVRSALKESPRGRRIDYLLYKAGPNITAETMSCQLPLPDRIPGKQISYSDHEAVTATIRLARTNRGSGGPMSGREFYKMQGSLDPDARMKAAEDGLAVIEESLRTVGVASIWYTLFAVICLVLLIAAFIPTGLEIVPVYLDILLFLVRLCLIVTATYLSLMALLFHKKERHALLSTKATLQLILDNKSHLDIA